MLQSLLQTVWAAAPSLEEFRASDSLGCASTTLKVAFVFWTNRSADFLPRSRSVLVGTELLHMTEEIISAQNSKLRESTLPLVLSSDLLGESLWVAETGKVRTPISPSQELELVLRDRHFMLSSFLIGFYSSNEVRKICANCLKDLRTIHTLPEHS